ncbi:MAG: hypothetical protein HGB12_11725, partial [Bacteroidetes bacterium]|nr:hypothetical protein [Bacteroidota bacterium]
MTKKITSQILKGIMYAFFAFHFSLIAFYCSAQGIAINTTGNSAKDAAFLEIGEGSDTQGLLIPRVNLIDVEVYLPLIGTSVTSLIVYSSTSPTNGNGVGYYYWSGSKWLNIPSPSNGPGTSGQVLTSGGAGSATTWTTPSTNTYSAGTGLSLSSNTFNSAWTASGNDIYNNNTGNVGIGTTGPQGKLGIAVGNDQFIFYQNADNRLNIQTLLDGQQFTTYGAYGGAENRLSLQPLVGNVGIGTTNPTAKLHVAGVAGVDGIRFPDSTLQTTAASSKFGGTGADGALTISSGNTNIDLGGARIFTKNYSSISISGTGSITFTNPHANGTIIIIKCKGNATLTSSAAPMIDASGMGGAGGSSITISTNTSGYGGSGNGGVTENNIQTNGNSTFNGGGAATLSTSAFGPLNTFPSQILAKYPKIFVGAGGGGGQSVKSSGTATLISGAGGNGGGGLIIEIAGAINFTTANGISVNGKNGGNGIKNWTVDGSYAAGGGG